MTLALPDFQCLPPKLVIETLRSFNHNTLSFIVISIDADITTNWMDVLAL